MPNKEGTTVLTGPTPCHAHKQKYYTKPNQTLLFHHIRQYRPTIKPPTSLDFCPKETPFSFLGEKEKRKEETYLQVACFPKLRLDLKNKTILCNLWLTLIDCFCNLQE